MLGLSVDLTSVNTATLTEADYAKELDRDFKGVRKSLKQKLADEVITQEQFEVEKDENQKQYDADLAHLNKLKNEWNDNESWKRELEKSQMDNEFHAWTPMYKPIPDIKSLKHQVIQARPLNHISEEESMASNATATSNAMLTELRVVKAENRKAGIDDLFFHTLECVDKAKRNLLLMNDELFEQTEPAFSLDSWSQEMEEWLHAYTRLYADNKFGFRHTSALDRREETPAVFKEMIRPTSLQIKELDDQEIEDYSKAPERVGDISIQEILRKKLLEILFQGI